MEKICFITPQFKTGGGNRVFIELANQLVKKNKVEIIYPNNSLEKNTFIVDKDVDILPIGKYFNSNILKLLNLFYTLFWIRKNKKNYKLIITDPIMSIFYFILPLRNTFRFIQADDYRLFDDREIIKNIFVLNIYKILTKISYKSKNIRYIFNSRYVYEKFLKERKSHIDYKLVHPAINKIEFRNRNVRKIDELNICIIARKNPMKGFDDFLEAWKQIDFKDKINNVYIVSHENLSKFNLTDKKFKIIKPRSDNDISRVMNESHIFISTSWWEGFGLPPLEAMACGSSVIVSDNGGINEYGKTGYNCLIYPPKNIDKLIEKLQELVNNNSKIKDLVTNSEKTIEKFSWEKSSLEFIKILKEN